MKTANDPRHQKRALLVEELFSLEFTPQEASSDAKIIWEKKPQIDELIKSAAPEWPIDKIARIDHAILLLSVWELTENKSTPPKVVIDEAVELAKTYGNDNSAKFVNGVLGTILKKINEPAFARGYGGQVN